MAQTQSEIRYLTPLSGKRSACSRIYSLLNAANADSLLSNAFNFLNTNLESGCFFISSRLSYNRFISLVSS